MSEEVIRCPQKDCSFVGPRNDHHQHFWEAHTNRLTMTEMASSGDMAADPESGHMSDAKLRDEVALWVEMAVHKYRVAADPVVLNEVVEESVQVLCELVQEARQNEWQRIYSHFEGLNPTQKLPDLSPQRSVLIELEKIKP